MKAALVFDRYAVWAQTTDVVLLRSCSLGPSLAATAVVAICGSTGASDHCRDGVCSQRTG